MISGKFLSLFSSNVQQLKQNNIKTTENNVRPDNITSKKYAISCQFNINYIVCYNIQPCYINTCSRYNHVTPIHVTIHNQATLICVADTTMLHKK